MYPAVTNVVANQDFTLSIAFGNGEDGVIDMKPHLTFGPFRKIADFENFKKVSVSFDTIEWDCGADLDPEFVYAHSRKTETA